MKLYMFRGIVCDMNQISALSLDFWFVSPICSFSHHITLHLNFWLYVGRDGDSPVSPDIFPGIHITEF